MSTNAELEFLRAAVYSQSGFAPQLRPQLPPQHSPAPLPSQWPHLLGSIEMNVGSEQQYEARIYFAPLPLQDCENLMRQINTGLMRLGWHAPQHLGFSFTPSGFLPSTPMYPEFMRDFEPPDPATNLLHDAAQLAATWQTDPTGQADQNFAMLQLQAGMAYHHWQRSATPQPAALPALQVPAHWHAQNIGAGGNGNEQASHLQSFALLTGEGYLSELHAAYAEQLMQAGWQLQSEATTPTLHASHWHTPQGSEGLLAFIPHSTGYLAQLSLTTLLSGRQTGDMGSSWFSF